MPKPNALERLAERNCLQRDATGAIGRREFEAEQEQLDRRTYELDAETAAAPEPDRSGRAGTRPRGESHPLQPAARRRACAGGNSNLQASANKQRHNCASWKRAWQRRTTLSRDFASRRGASGSGSREPGRRSAELAGSAQLNRSAHRRPCAGQIAEAGRHCCERLQGEQAQAEQSLAHHSGALERLEQSEHAAARRIAVSSRTLAGRGNPLAIGDRARAHAWSNRCGTRKSASRICGSEQQKPPRAANPCATSSLAARARAAIRSNRF